MASSTSDASHELVAALLKLSKKNPKLVKSSLHPAPQDPDVQIRSWKMNEFKYYDVPSPFPTLARGLFTTWIGDSAVDKENEGPGKYAIVARGYDKFFNIGEVPWTNWAAIEKHTKGPYAVTLKSNGCIIFIAALSPTTLVITSKHSIGPISGVPISHAEMGEQWLHKHLKSVGKTVEQLASTLLEKKWTAVAELCDDSFEEHVLAIPETKTGLHLHGLNSNQGSFNTQPSDAVNAFAKEWGFIETPFLTFDNVNAVKEFTDEASRTGKWNDEAVEGFVVRALIRDGVAKDRDSPPYPPGSSFFFKVKFDEPYMMYRDWRELTRSMLSAQAKGQDPKLSRAKLARTETRVYKDWVQKEMVNNKEAFKDFQKGKGIIAVRDNFLKYLETPEGQEKLAKEGGTTSVGSSVPTASGSTAASTSKRKRGQKVAIVPIAIPGCGKTAIGVALAHLFGFGHVQNDNIKEKKTTPVFNRNLTSSLRGHDVVYADRNNHLHRHRQDIREHLIKGFGPDDVRLIALNWGLNVPAATAHRITADRVVGRGANHQTLRPDNDGKHEEVIWMFINQREELDETEVDDVIEMELEESFEDSLMRAINGIVDLLELEKPSQEKFGEALRLATGYQTSVRNERGGGGGGVSDRKKDSGPRYFGLLPEVDLEELLNSRIVEGSAPASALEFWKELKSSKRFTLRPHITITHTKSLPSEQSIWDACSDLAKASTPATFKITFRHLVWDGRVMALTVDDISLVEGGGEDVGKKWLDELPDKVRKRLHVTVGTRHPSIQPFEAKALVEAYKKGEGEPKLFSLELNPASEEPVSAKGRIKGLFN